MENEKELLSQAIEFYKNRDFEKAKNKYIELLKINPKSSTVYGNLGVVYKQLGDINTAIKYYIESIKLDQKNLLSKVLYSYIFFLLCHYCLLGHIQVLFLEGQKIL